MKYELFDEKIICGRVLHRIRYCDNSLGGWIESEKNLDKNSNARVYGDACVYGNARVYGNACVYGNARVFGKACVYDYACVFGNACVSDNARVYDFAYVYDYACVFVNARVYGNARVSGDARVYDNARIFGKAYVSGDACVYGDARVYGNVRVSGDARVYYNACVSGDARVNISGNACVIDDAWKTPPLQIQGSMFFFSVSSKNHITVGCKTKTIAEWKKTYEEEFIKNHFTEAQQIEYKQYFNLASNLYGWSIQLPI